MNALARLSLAALLLAPLRAEDAPTPGHSAHGEAFNEGPRQSATLIPGASSVQFAVTTKSPDAQKFFNQGVTQLHGFAYFEAERSFRQVAYLDPDCAMAYCGMAMANVNNEKRAAGFVNEATKRRDKASPREQRWIDMWSAYYADLKKDEKARREALAKAFEELIHSFPDDIEARAFYIVQLWENGRHGVPLQSRLAVEALAQSVLDKAPMHPGIHHYLIHLWNKGGKDPRALASAARCGQSAPAIAHLWHMSGHTFSELKRYADAAWQQEASARVDHAYIAAARVMPEQIHNYAHNNDWLVKDLAYVGRVHDAIDLAKNLIELPRLGSGKQQGWRMGRDRLLEFGVTFELWEELTMLEATPFLAPDPDAPREADRLRALGVAWYSKGDTTRGDEKLAALEQQLTKVRADEKAKPADAKPQEKKPEEQKPAKVEKPEPGAKPKPAAKKPASRVPGLENAIADLKITRALASGNLADVREQLPKAKDLPSRRLARIHLALGDHAKAEQLARDLIKADAGQVLPYALLAHILAQAGKTDDARKTFQQLRERSADLDLDAPAFARLAPIAEQLNLPKDWRVPRTVSRDAGERPQLADLGPFRWRPYVAPDFTLTDRDLQPVSLQSRRGKPVLVVFYLGAGCAGCMTQLNTFAPLAKAYTDAGIEIIAVSTDSTAGLAKTFESAKDKAGFSFKIASDHSLDAFRAYRAFDDFESMPLHGAFLIDAAGYVRWQNISYQPFNDAKWLLEEATRLLAIPVLPAAATVGR
ncbi:MAG: redoxin domain-containing protein [Chthoniobacteraceae bacterium]